MTNKKKSPKRVVKAFAVLIDGNLSHTSKKDPRTNMKPNDYEMMAMTIATLHQKTYEVVPCEIHYELPKKK